MRRPITTVVIFVACTLVGLIASRLLPLEQFPDIEFPGIFVLIPYEGSTPEEVERLITRPVEEALATLSGVRQMQSTSSESQSQIQLEFDWGQSMGTKGIEARAKVDGIRHALPEDVRRILVFTGSFADQPILQLRISSERDLSHSYEMLERLVKRPLERVEGVSKVELQGIDPLEIRILLDSDRLAAHGIAINRLRALLERSNFAVSAGRITDGGQRFSVRPRGEFASIEDIENIVIDGHGLRLGDVASVELRSPERDYGRRLDGSPAVGIAVSKSTGANMVEVTDRVMAEVARISELPQMQGINILALDNQADNVRESLSDLLKEGLIGALLAIVMLYVFLRQLPSTLIVTACIPFSLTITLGVLYFAGLSLNILTMMGLMLAVGMLVDNAVVIVESIFHRRAQDPARPFEATLSGVREVGLAVLAGTATTIIVFVPVMFGAKTDISIFLTHVSVTIIVALVTSLIVAQTLVPMLAARIPPPPPAAEGAWIQRLTRRYARSLEWILVHPWWTTLGIVLVCVTGVLPLLLQLVKFDAFPQEAGRRLYMNYHIEGEHPLEQVEAAVGTVEGWLLGHREELDVRSVYTYYEPAFAQSVILLTDENEATLGTREVIERVQKGLPAIAIGKPSFEFEQQGGGEGFSLQISGDSTERLNELARDVVRVLSTVGGLQGVRSDAESGRREVRVTVDRVRAAAVGLSSREVAEAIAIAMRGQNLREFRGDQGEVEVRLAFRESDKQSIDQLAGLPLFTAGGRRITLGSIAELDVAPSPDTIRRTDRQTAVVLRANLADGTGMSDVQPKVEKLMNEFELPPGYTWKFGEGFERQDETQQMMLQNILLGIACIFLVMAALFESLLFPFSIILGSIVFSVFGVFLFFAATGTTFTFMASIGIMILIGVVVNNGIVLIDRVNQLRRQGMARNAAIVAGGRDRLRPILMTVATTVVGLAPLAVSTTQVGGDGPAYFPMARTIIGGLTFSTIVSLLIVPALYACFDSLSAWARKVMRTARAVPLARPAS